MEVSVADITALFASARAQGVLRVKVGELEFHMTPDLPSVRRGPTRVGKGKPEPEDALDLALRMRGQPGTGND